MKTVKICIILMLIFFLSACNSETNNGMPINSAEKSTSEIREHQYLTNDIIQSSFLNANEGMTINLTEIGLKEVTVRKMELGNVDNLDYQQGTYIISDYRYGQSACHDSYLAVEVSDKILFYDFGNSCYDDFLYMYDVDGDGFDEIIIQQDIDSFGGTGQFISRILKVTDDKFIEIFESSGNDSNGNYINYDTGYSSSLKDGFKVELNNRFTGYSTTIDFTSEKEQLRNFFDETGKVIKQIDTIGCSSFFKFEPKDVDSDDVYEVECIQGIESMFWSGGIGEARSILKYNEQLKGFEVIQTEFVQVR